MSSQIPRGATFFEIFDLPPHPTLDLQTIEARFRERSLLFHPDRMTQASPKERLAAVEDTATLNEAYRTLKDPVRRATYLLKLQGIDLDKEGGSSTSLGMPQGAPSVPMEFLEEMMTLREGLDGLRERKDLAGAQKMGEEVAARRVAALAAANEALVAKNPTKASHELIKVRYFARFLEEVEAMEEEALA